MKATIHVQNLKCEGCANTITGKLSAIEQVANIVVAVEEGVVSFDYITESTLEKAKEVLKKNGYPEVGQDNGLGTKAKSYVSCAIGKMT